MKRYVYGLMLLTVSILTSCHSTKYITKEVPVEVIKEVPVEVVKTEYINSTLLDSTFIKDSIDRYLKGDTLVIYKERQTFKYKYKTDTLVIRDTIPMPIETQIPVTVKEEVLKEVHKLYWYQEALMFIGIVSLVCMGIFLLIKRLTR